MVAVAPGLASNAPVIASRSRTAFRSGIEHRIGTGNAVRLNNVGEALFDAEGRRGIGGEGALNFRYIRTASRERPVAGASARGGTHGVLVQLQSILHTSRRRRAALAILRPAPCNLVPNVVAQLVLPVRAVARGDTVPAVARGARQRRAVRVIAAERAVVVGVGFATECTTTQGLAVSGAVAGAQAHLFAAADGHFRLALGCVANAGPGFQVAN